MDCAEGSYGQLYDHLGSAERVDDAILKTKVVFITHLHGDHQLGILKILQERDRLMND
jgi:ribonuclease Z